MFDLTFFGSAESQVIKCVEKKTGKVTYTDGKCESGVEGSSVRIIDNVVPSDGRGYRSMSPEYRGCPSGGAPLSVEAMLQACQQALQKSDALMKNPRADPRMVSKALEDAMILCPESSSTEVGCRTATVMEPVPVLFNNDEVMVLDSGEVVKNVSYQYNYAYEYNPRVKVCLGAGKMYFGGKEIRIRVE